MSNINKQALREAAEKATPGNWWIDSHGQAMVSFIDNDVLEVFATVNKRTTVRHEDTGNLSRWRNDNDATFIATADPATVLALLDELEAAKQDAAKWFKAFEKAVSVGARYEERIAELEAREVVLPSVQDVHPLGPQSAKIFCDFHRNIINRCADEIRKVGVNVSIKGE